MFSGDTSFAQQVVSRLAGKAKEAMALDFSWMEKNAELVYQECFEEAVEKQVLRPFLLRRDTFLSRGKDMQPLDSQIVATVNEKLKEFQLNCQIMFCGFDSNGPHCGHVFGEIDRRDGCRSRFGLWRFAGRLIYDPLGKLVWITRTFAFADHYFFPESKSLRRAFSSAAVRQRSTWIRPLCGPAYIESLRVGLFPPVTLIGFFRFLGALEFAMFPMMPQTGC
jgi:hypothetical protein